MQSDAPRRLADLVDDLDERDDIDAVTLEEVSPATREATLSLRLTKAETQTVAVPAPRDSDGAADGEPDLADDTDDADLEGDVNEDDADESEDDQDDAEKSFEAGVPLVSNQPYVDLDGDEAVTVHVAAAQNGPAECNYVRDASRLQAKAPGEFDAPVNVCGVCQDRANPTPAWLTQDDEREDDQDEAADDEDAPTGGNSTAVDVDTSEEDVPDLGDLEEPLDYTNTTHLRAAYHGEPSFAAMADHFEVSKDAIWNNCIDAGIHEPEQADDVDQPREVSLPDGLALDDVQDAVAAHQDLGAVADALDLECGRTRVLLVHLNLYEQVRDVTNGYGGDSR